MLVPASGQGVTSQPDEREVTVSHAGLDRAGDQAALDPLDLLTDADQPGIEVNVLPAEAEHLATAHAVQDEKEESRIQRVGPGGPGEPQSFIG